MTDAELNAATEGLQFMLDGYRDKNSWEGYPRMLSDGIAAITTLRAQLAEAEACNRGLVRLNDAIQARADRAEAALAAQIEADAGLCGQNEMAIPMDHTKRTLGGLYCADAWCGEGKHAGHGYADLIRAQPHDRTALDRMLAEAREKALREAAEALDDEGWLGMSEHRILALIEKEKTK